MKTLNIDNEVDELNKKFHALEIKQQQLVDRIRELESTRKEQWLKIEKLQRAAQGTETAKLSESSKRKILTRESFKEDDLVQVTNNRNGQFGIVGKIYRITRCQVHFTDIREGGGSLSRAFHNVKVLHLSDDERNNLTNIRQYDGKRR